jgi:hypothetical protein
MSTARVVPGSSEGTTRAALRRAPFTVAAAIIAAFVADLALDPTHNHVPLCPLHAMTGLNCPFCGSLRAAYSIGHGRVSAALHDNVLFVAALPVLFVYWIDWVIRSRRGHETRKVPRSAVIALTALAIAFAVVRNLPFGRALSPV